MVFDKDKLKELIDERQVKSQEDLQALMRVLTKEVIDALYEGELTEHLGYEKHEQGKSTDGNTRNGKGTKTVKSHVGAIDLEPPRDRAGTFDPQVVKKRQRDISGIEQKVISMYAKGMSTRDISAHIHEIYLDPLSPPLRRTRQSWTKLISSIVST